MRSVTFVVVEEVFGNEDAEVRGVPAPPRIDASAGHVAAFSVFFADCAIFTFYESAKGGDKALSRVMDCTSRRRSAIGARGT